MKKRRIAFLCDGLYEVGGIQRVVARIANALIETRRYEVSYICVESAGTNCEQHNNYNVNSQAESIFLYYDKKKDVKWAFGGIYRRGVRKIKALDCPFLADYAYMANYGDIPIEQLIKMINQKEIDIVIGVAGQWSVILAYISNRINAKTIGWQHNSWSAYFETPNRYCWGQTSILKKYLGNLDIYVTLNKEDEKAIRDNFGGVNVISIPNPRSFESEKKSNVSEKCILFAGRMVMEHKGIDLLIDIFEKFHKKNEDWRLRLVGEGEDQQRICEIIESKENLKEYIDMLPFTNDIISELLRASMVVMPSRWEGMPMFALEALEVGVPIIASDIAAFRNIITDGVEGYLCGVGDIDSFCKKMTDIANSKKMRETMSNAAIVKSQNFSIEKILGMWEKCFD